MLFRLWQCRRTTNSSYGGLLHCSRAVVPPIFCLLGGILHCCRELRFICRELATRLQVVPGGASFVFQSFAMLDSALCRQAQILSRASEKEESAASINSCEREVPAHSHTELPLAAELPASQPWRSKPVRAFAICIALPCFFFQAIAVWDSALCLQAQIWQKVILLQHCIIPIES